jgi:hypothetical protein
MRAGPSNWYVAMKDIPMNIWYILLGTGKHELNESEVNKQGA